MSLSVRPAREADADAIWSILAPMIGAGETYPLPRDMDRAAALAYWFSPAHTVYVAEDGADGALGTYYLKPNQTGAGAHVANCGYVVGANAQGRGVARTMCAHSFAAARAAGFRAMQFNFVVSTNTRAVALWHKMGFETVGRLPGAFDHPRVGYVDALVMFRTL